MHLPMTSGKGCRTRCFQNTYHNRSLDKSGDVDPVKYASDTQSTGDNQSSFAAASCVNFSSHRIASHRKSPFTAGWRVPKHLGRGINPGRISCGIPFLRAEVAPRSYSGWG